MAQNNKYIAERVYSGVIIFLCLFLLAVNIIIAFPVFSPKNIAVFAALGLVCLSCLIFIIRPKWWPFLVIPHYLFALGAAFLGKIELSALTALAAFGLALIRGFFLEHWKIKVGIGVGVYLAFILTQFRFSVITVFSTLACSIFLCGILVVLVLELRDSIRDVLPPEIRIPEKPDLKSELMLCEYDLSQRELYALYAVLFGKTYSQIGETLFCSTSTVKQMMRKIYQQFGVSDRYHFIDLVSQYKIVPPDWYRVPEEFSGEILLPKEKSPEDE